MSIEDKKEGVGNAVKQSSEHNDQWTGKNITVLGSYAIYIIISIVCFILGVIFGIITTISTHNSLIGIIVFLIIWALPTIILIIKHGKSEHKEEVESHVTSYGLGNVDDTATEKYSLENIKNKE